MEDLSAEVAEEDPMGYSRSSLRVTARIRPLLVPHRTRPLLLRPRVVYLVPLPQEGVVVVGGHPP